MEIGDNLDSIKLNITINITEEQELKKPIGFNRHNPIIKVVREMPKIINNTK
jgi:hypothetical protein